MPDFSGKWIQFTDELTRSMPTPMHSIAWWEEAAKRGVVYFEDKAGYLRWVHASFGSDENRFAASVCWDIVKYREFQPRGHTVPEHNRQVNAHLVGKVDQDVLKKIVSRLDCNVRDLTDTRERLKWLVRTANLVILMPDWKKSNSCLTEVAVARELNIKTVFLHEVLPDVDPPVTMIVQDLIDHLAKHGIGVTVVSLDERFRDG